MAAANVAAAKVAIDVASTPESFFKPVSMGRQVKFDLGLNTFHEVTPYAEVYGQHPREFHFARGPPISALDSLLDPVSIVPVLKKGCRPGDCELGEDEDDDDDSEQLLSKAGNLVMLVTRPLPWTAWVAIGVLLFLFRAFGPELYQDLTSQELPKIALTM
jgi:hypothetical protein